MQKSRIRECRNKGEKLTCKIEKWPKLHMVCSCYPKLELGNVYCPMFWLTNVEEGPWKAGEANTPGAALDCPAPTMWNCFSIFFF